MIRTAKTESTIIGSAAELGRRFVKFLGLGRSDIRTARQAAPYGVDSNPIAGMVAIYAPTATKGSTVVLGYLNVDAVAAVGEYRTYSTDADGVIKFFIHQKNDGTCEIGGDADNMVRYSKMADAFNELNNKFNAHVSSYNAHTHPGVTPGPGITAPSATPAQPSTANIALARIAEIKTL